MARLTTRPKTPKHVGNRHASIRSPHFKQPWGVKSLTFKHGVIVSAISPRVDRRKRAALRCRYARHNPYGTDGSRAALPRHAWREMRQARGTLEAMTVDEANHFVNVLNRSPSHQLTPPPSGFASLMARMSSGSGIAPGTAVTMTHIVLIIGLNVPAPVFQSLARAISLRIRSFSSGRPARLNRRRFHSRLTV